MYNYTVYTNKYINIKTYFKLINLYKYNNRNFEWGTKSPIPSLSNKLSVVSPRKKIITAGNKALTKIP